MNDWREKNTIYQNGYKLVYSKAHQRWEIEEDYSSCEDVQTDDISVSSSSPSGTPSREMKRNQRFGSSKVGSRLATQKIVQHQPISSLRSPSIPLSDYQGRPYSLVGTPAQSTISEPNRLLPQRNIQRRQTKKGLDGQYYHSLRNDHSEHQKVTISPSLRYPNYQSMPRNYGRSNSSNNLKGETNGVDSPKYKGSRFSLTSNPEDKEEISRLRKYVETYEMKINQLQDQIVSKERQLEQNQTVVAVFEQQLSKFRSTTPDEQTTDGDHSEAPKKTSVSTTAVTADGDVMSPVQNLNNVRSCGSLTSISSHTSGTSGSSNEDQKKKEQRRNWLRDSFRSAFGRNGAGGSKKPGFQPRNGENSLCIIDDSSEINSHDQTHLDSVESLRSALQEKDSRLRESDSKLTDIRLAALNYQHELEQMKNEIRQLREERDNLKSNANRMSHALTIGSYNSTTTGTLNSNKTSDGDFETDNKIVVFLEIFEAEKKIIGHIDIDEPGQEAKLEAEISKVFHSYLNNIDQDCLGLSDKSIINTHANEGVATIRVTFPAAVALNESIKLPKASQLFEACIDTRRVLIAGGAAHQKNEVASRLAAILACKEFDYSSISQIPHHVIKTAGCLQTLEDFTKVFDPPSDEPEAEQKRPHILLIDLSMANQDNLVRTLRGRDKTPIVIAIGRDNEITPDCAEIFQTFHLSSFGSDLASKLRQKWIDYSIAKHGQIKHKRSVQNQIKFLEKLHDKLNKIIVSYQNANSKLGPAWFLNCPWNHEHFQSWFARLWNHKLKPFLQANIIEGIKLYGDKGNEWDDIITFIKNSYPWTEDDLFDNLTAADVGLTRIETDPLLVMLKGVLLDFVEMRQF